MVKAILRGLRREARARNCLRFECIHSVFYAQPSDDQDAWREVLDSVKKTFGSSTTRSTNLKKGTDLYRKIERLLPCEINRIQIASRPLLRRVPTDIGYTQRGAAVLYNDESIELESEDLATIEFPKQKFPKPVVAAIFFYGYADEDKPKDEKDDKQFGPEGLVPGLRTDITFPGLSEAIPAEVRASIARLHIYAGHPSKQEFYSTAQHTWSYLISDLIMCGTPGLWVLQENYQSSTSSTFCSIPVLTGQFGERIQIDRFWIRDLQTVNHCFLGVVDMATTYQQAARLEFNGSEYVYSILSRMWLQPFGHPLVVEADDDRNFGGFFKEMIEGAGTHLLIVPAEAHWRIGTVERRNAILRTIVERMIDERAITDGTMLDYAMVAACQAINSATTTRQRGPFQAVFGKVPRFPTSVTSDLCW